jgi:hypothetical protein
MRKYTEGYTTIRIYESDKQELNVMGIKGQDYAQIIHELIAYRREGKEMKREEQPKNTMEMIA